MANLKQAILWMFEGKKVTHCEADDDEYYYWDDNKGFLDVDGDSYRIDSLDLGYIWKVHVLSTLEEKEAELIKLRREIVGYQRFLAQRCGLTIPPEFING